MLMHIDPDLPECPGCHRHFNDNELIHEVDNKMVCAECKDDQLERETGCRFGEAICNHPDCKS